MSCPASPLSRRVQRGYAKFNARKVVEEICQDTPSSPTRCRNRTTAELYNLLELLGYHFFNTHSIPQNLNTKTMIEMAFLCGFLFSKRSQTRLMFVCLDLFPKSSGSLLMFFPFQLRKIDTRTIQSKAKMTSNMSATQNCPPGGIWLQIEPRHCDKIVIWSSMKQPLRRIPA